MYSLNRFFGYSVFSSAASSARGRRNGELHPYGKKTGIVRSRERIAIEA